MKPEDIIDFVKRSYQLDGREVTRPFLESLYEHYNLSKKFGPELVDYPSLMGHFKAIQHILDHKKRVPGTDDITYLYSLISPQDFQVFRTSGVIRCGLRCPSPDQIKDLLQNWFDLWGKIPYKKASKSRVSLIRHAIFFWLQPMNNSCDKIGRLLWLWDCLYHGSKCELFTTKDYDEYLSYLVECRERLIPRYDGKWS